MNLEAKSGLGGKFSATMIRRSDLDARAGFGGTYDAILRDRWGDIKWIDQIKNRVPTEGLNHALSSTLAGGTQITSWFLGLIDNVNFTEVAADDTAAKIATTKNHPTTNDWQELDDYDETTRQAFTAGTVASASVDNSASVAQYAINATVVINGAFLVSSNVKGGTAGTLYSAGSFSGGNKNADSGDTLQLTYTASAQDV